MDTSTADLLQFQATPTIQDVLRKAISIWRSSPKTFFLVALTLILPLSFAILAHSRFTLPLLDIVPIGEPVETSADRHPWLNFFIFLFGYPIFVFLFSLLSTAAVVFTVASLYTSRPVSFGSTLFAIPRVFKRLFITFLFVAVLMCVYNVAYIVCVLALVALVTSYDHPYAFWLGFIFLFVVFLAIHVYITTIWHLASVISVLEPLYGLAAMKKSKQLLKGNCKLAMELVFVYLVLCVAVTIVYGEAHYLEIRIRSEFLWQMIRSSVDGLFVGILAIVNLTGLLVQSVFYFVCKSFHGEAIDKSVLYENLGGYLGEYVPLNATVEMEAVEI